MSTRVLVRLLLLVAGLLVVGYLVRQIGPDVVWSALRSLSWRLLLVFLFPMCIVVVLDTVGWRFTFLRPPRSLTHLLAVRLAGEAVNLGTPTASVGGEPVKAYLLRPGVPLREGLASVIVDKTTTVAALVLFLALGLLVGARLLPLSSPLMITMAVLLGLEIVCVAGFVTVQLAGVLGVGGRLLRRFKLAPGRGQAMLEGMDQTLRALYLDHRSRLLVSGLFHLLAFGLGTFEIYVVVRLLDVPISLPAALAIGAFGSAVKFFSFMIPASLGALEGGNVAIFSAFGLGGAVGLTYTLVRRLREIVWITVGFTLLSLLSARPAALVEPDLDDVQS
ncbi:MAG: lysylphosphatidylglycerol synthase transmembrane domain-containing protein [Candidatus Rokuibacteriota bacterium]